MFKKAVDYWHYFIYKITCKKYRKRIKNKNFTILCNSCLGGKIYNYLGMRFDSPTINLWMSTRDFCKLFANLNYYKNTKFVFKADTQYPVGILNDITVYFNHYKTNDDAQKKWDERMKRIHGDNIYIITYDDGQVSPEEIEKLSFIHPRNIVVLTNKKETNFKNAFYCHSLRKEPSASTHMMVMNKFKGYQTVLDEFDFVNFLNN